MAAAIAPIMPNVPSALSGMTNRLSGYCDGLVDATGEVDGDGDGVGVGDEEGDAFVCGDEVGEAVGEGD